MSTKVHEEFEKLKAAYALNMCTVSVSQIVEYNDSYILEQEYEAILNNLNLEQMPKDEALLDILVKLLNVITFFRIDKIKRDQIEKKYQRRMKNAIWSAIPNIGFIVSGNPVTMALSLATQIGIGYMNYRKEKANALADREDSEVELRITAIEQFNALRRELFTTAWRLADEYKFPDRYRLTERQISQYNRILMDTDEIRKYERLESIKEKFEAYLPFWYFIGHTAKFIAEDDKNALSKDERNYYRKEAKKHFEKYYGLNSFNILRQDELSASFALEYIDLLLVEEKPDYEKIKDLLRHAVVMSGNVNDLLELCAMSYLKIGQTVEAEKILRNLVNEDYNIEANARLLSRIYVSDFLRMIDSQKMDTSLVTMKYKLLSNRVAPKYLFPMPERISLDTLQEDKSLQEKYLEEQKFVVKREYREALIQFITKYIVQFNKAIPTPRNNVSDEYFLNSEEAKVQRKKDIEHVLHSDKKDEYQKMIYSSGYRERFVELINEAIKALNELTIFRTADIREYFIRLLRKNLLFEMDTLKEIHTKLENKEFTAEDYEKLQEDFSFRSLSQESFEELKEYISNTIEGKNSLEELDNLELELIDFCKAHKIMERNINPCIEVESINYLPDIAYIPSGFLTQGDKENGISPKTFEQMLRAVKEMADSITLDEKKVKLLIHGTDSFNLYFENENFYEKSLKETTLAILDDLFLLDSDLLLTCDGVIPVQWNKVSGLYHFDSLKYRKNKIGLDWMKDYSNIYINIDNLYLLFQKLKKIRDDGRM
jgi:hypothetical protein